MHGVSLRPWWRRLPVRKRGMTMNPWIAGAERWKAMVGPLGPVVLAVLLVGEAVAAAQVVVKPFRRRRHETLISVAS